MALSLSRRFFLKQIETPCSIGIHDFERKAKQRILIDLEVLLDPQTEPQNDSIEEALDYDKICAGVIALATSKHFDLQETLASAIFMLVRQMPGVIGLSVRTCKPDVYENVAEAAYQISDIS